MGVIMQERNAPEYYKNQTTGGSGLPSLNNIGRPSTAVTRRQGNRTVNGQGSIRPPLPLMRTTDQQCDNTPTISQNRPVAAPLTPRNRSTAPRNTIHQVKEPQNTPTQFRTRARQQNAIQSPRVTNSPRSPRPVRRNVEHPTRSVQSPQQLSYLSILYSDRNRKLAQEEKQFYEKLQKKGVIFIFYEKEKIVKLLYYYRIMLENTTKNLKIEYLAKVKMTKDIIEIIENRKITKKERKDISLLKLKSMTENFTSGKIKKSIGNGKYIDLMKQITNKPGYTNILINYLDPSHQFIPSI